MDRSGRVGIQGLGNSGFPDFRRSGISLRPGSAQAGLRGVGAGLGRERMRRASAGIPLSQKRGKPGSNPTKRGIDNITLDLGELDQLTLVLEVQLPVQIAADTLDRTFA